MGIAGVAGGVGRDDGGHVVGHCQCGQPLALPKRADRRGRPRVYCSNACMKVAHRQRAASLKKWLTELGT